MNRDNLTLVAEFMKASDQPVSQGFEDQQGIRLGFDLIEEEFSELEDIVWDALHYPHPELPDDIREDIVHELADLVYTCYWLAARIGIDLDQAIRLVHQANMSKIGPDGKVVKGYNGKVLKGKNFKPASLAQVVKDAPVTM